jgi:hypothetical protein
MALDPPWRLDPHENIVEVGWGGGHMLTASCSYFEQYASAEARSGADQDCSITVPDGSVYFPFRNASSFMPSIGEGNSADLTPEGNAKLLAGLSIFTADPVRSYSKIISPHVGQVEMTQINLFQTVFIPLASHMKHADANKDLAFKFTHPGFTEVPKYRPYYVAWDTAGCGASAAPTDFTYSSCGLTIFDQQAAFRWMTEHCPGDFPNSTTCSLMCGNVFATIDEAAAYAAAHGISGSNYSLTLMPIDYRTTQSAFNFNLGTFTTSDTNKFEPDISHGPYKFPLLIPTASGPFDQGERDWPTYPFGYYDDFFAWPTAKDSLLATGIASARCATIPETVTTIKVESGAIGNKQWRIHNV